LYGYNPIKNEAPLVVRSTSLYHSPKKLETRTETPRQLVFSDERSASPTAETQDDVAERQTAPTQYQELHALAQLADEEDLPPTQCVDENNGLGGKVAFHLFFQSNHCGEVSLRNLFEILP
jgi:hypothetical protein